MLLVPLERLYKRPGLPVKNYPRRSASLMSEHVRRVADGKQTSQCAFRRVFTTRKKSPSLDLLGDHWRGLMHKPVCNIPLGQWPVLSPTVPDLNTPPPSGVTAVHLQHETHWKKILKLDSMVRPGLSEKDFFGLFAKCDACRQVVARIVFDYHECRPLGVDGLELTDCEE